MGLLLAFCSFCLGLYLLLASKWFWRWLDADLVLEGEPVLVRRGWDPDAISRDWVVVERFVDEEESEAEEGEGRRGGKRVRWG